MSVRLGEWIRSLVAASVEYGDPLGIRDEERRAKLLSPQRLDLESSVFLEHCESTAICNAEGTLLKPDTLFFLESSDLYWWADWFPSDLIGHDFYFLFVNSETYMVDLRNWREVMSDVFREFNPDDWMHLNHSAEILSRFEGWAFCISEEDEARMLEYIVGRFDLPRAVLDDLDSNDDARARQRTKGRPPLEKAKAEFKKMGFDKGGRSWEQLARHLEQKTGEKPSPRTLRSWISDSNTGPPPRVQPGET